MTSDSIQNELGDAERASQQGQAPEFKSIMIVGMGMIGGSIAIALKSLEPAPTVIGIDPNAQSLQKALDQGIIDKGYENSDPRVNELLALNAVDLVILSMPVHFASEVFETIEKSGYRGAITDTASTKRHICEAAESILSDTSRFIPGHPMAGREINGIEGACKGLFTGKYWILCPDARTNNSLFLKLHSLVTSIGAKCISVERQNHDDMVAIVSHVPHMAASALVRLADRHSKEGHELFRLASGGFKDSTRIAAGSPALWADIAMSNKDAIADGIDELREILGNIELLIIKGDTDGLRDFLTRTSTVRKRIPSSWIPKSEKLVLLRISMSNHVGTIATVTSIAGKFGCNIQSIDIEHITADAAILEIMLTDEGDIKSLVSELDRQGFDTMVSLVEEDD